MIFAHVKITTTSYVLPVWSFYNEMNLNLFLHDPKIIEDCLEVFGIFRTSPGIFSKNDRGSSRELRTVFVEIVNKNIEKFSEI